MMTGYADMAISFYTVIAVIWFSIGALGRIYLLKRRRDSGNDVSLFDIFTILICGLYGPISIVIYVIFHFCMKAQDRTVFKGKKNKD